MSLQRLSVIALLLALAAPSPELRAQTLGPDWSEKLRAELKASVDRQLALKVRELRRELHAAIDEAIAGALAPSLDAVLLELEGKDHPKPQSVSAREAAVPERSTPSLEQLAQLERDSYARLEGLQRQFSELWGPDHPRTLQVSDELRWHPARTDLTPGQLLGIACESRPEGLPLIRPIAGGFAATAGLQAGGQLLALGDLAFKVGSSKEDLMRAMERAVALLRAHRPVGLRVRLGDEKGQAIQDLQLTRRPREAAGQPLPSIGEALEKLIQKTPLPEVITR